MSSPTVSTKLARIAEQSKRDATLVFTTLAHLMDEDFLTEAFHELRKDAAAGIDEMTVTEYCRRSYVIRTSPWNLIAEKYREWNSNGLGQEPLLRLVEAIGSSPVAPQLFGATSMYTLLLSDCENFRRGDSTLLICYSSTDRSFTFRHRSFSGRDDEKACSEADALQTLKLFLRVKYGILFEKPPA